jgi:membrane-associated protease RseP (regulator of RpoE activity)
MIICQACNAEIASPDRFCRSCGAPVPPLVEDLADTHRFDGAAQPSGAGQTASQDPTSPFYVGPRPSYAAGQNSAAAYQTGSLAGQLLHGLLRVRPKILWPVMFLVISLSLTAGVSVGTRALHWLSRMSHKQPAPTSGQAGMVQSPEVPRLSFEETVQNALGFRPAAVPDSDYPGVRGIFVAGLTSDDGPAALANIQAGDVLMELADQPVRNSSELTRVLNSLKAGDEVRAKLYHDGAIIASRIKVADASFAPFEQKLAARDLGFTGIDEVSRRCCVPGTKRWGVEVIKITENAPADLAGLQAGDVIVEFDKHPIRTPYELSRRIVAAKPRSRVLVKFYRGTTEQTVELMMGHRTDHQE